MTRQAYVFHDHALVVFWTPKAACTSLVYKIFRDYLSEDQKKALPRPIKRREWLKENGFLFSGRDAMEICKTRDYRSICLIREPYDRLVSAYINKFVRNQKDELTRMELLEPFALSFYKNDLMPKFEIPESSEYSGVSFRMFADAVCGKIDNRGKDEPKLNHHWNTQVPFFMVNSGFSYDELYKLSSADLFLKRFGELTGSTNEEDVHRNASAYEIESVEPLADKSSIDVISAGSVSKSQFHDPKIEAKVRKSFAIDYDFLKGAL